MIYNFWLILFVGIFIAAEKILPARNQSFFTRPLIGQDIFWFTFNTHLFGFIYAFLWNYGPLDIFSNFEAYLRPKLAFLSLANRPFWLQFLILLFVQDFLEWGIHNLLHRVPWLWSFHKLHHSITEMDWIGNYRFHWFEVLVYRSLKYLPLFLLNADYLAILAVAVVATAFGNFNHSNLKISLGPLKYIFNSPKFHIWHHAKIEKPHNFAIVFSFWDYLFRTAHTENRTPEIGFIGMEKYPSSLVERLIYPMLGKSRN